jgi:hypothetical protein
MPGGLEYNKPVYASNAIVVTAAALQGALSLSPEYLLETDLEVGKEYFGTWC